MSHEPEDTMPAGKSCCHADSLALQYASLAARIWLGVRALQTGIEKFAGYRAGDAVVVVDGAPNEEGLTTAAANKFYALGNYHGVPESMMTRFQQEPMMLKFALPLYDMLLGPILLILGITILLGVAYRSSLFALGLLYISLTWGLILIRQDDGVSWLGVHMILIIAALALARHDRLVIMKKW